MPPTDCGTKAYAAAGMGDDALELYDAVSISEETLRSFGENLGWEVISRQAARQEAHRRLSEQAGREVRDAEDALAEVARAPGGNRRTHNEQQAVNELSVTADRARAVLAFLSNGGEPNTKVLYPLDPEV